MTYLKDDEVEIAAVSADDAARVKSSPAGKAVLITSLKEFGWTDELLGGKKLGELHDLVDVKAVPLVKEASFEKEEESIEEVPFDEKMN